MRMLAQKLKDGKVALLEAPVPLVRRGMVLVRVAYSVVSSGTERATLRTARKSLIGKALERPEQVRRVLDVLGQQGPLPTYRAVKKRLEEYSPMGYSCAGFVEEVGEGVSVLSPGDKVACGGVGYANHAEYVAVPVNLCVRLRPDADLRRAAYNTVGAIAMQGVRQADLRLGECCVVIGLGLLGQLACMLLRASGVRVVGLDIDLEAVELARRMGVELAFLRGEGGLVEKVMEFTGGIGADAVLVTAGTTSNDPMNLAGKLLRKRGRVVIVGAVPTGFEREEYYRKELEVRMSCSYGPGRYDPQYEEKGVDYPVGYVRWTEKRNMEAFQELVYQGKVDVDSLTTHELSLENAAERYHALLTGGERHMGIVIRYDGATREKGPLVQVRGTSPLKEVTLAFVGAGSYPSSYLLPELKGRRDVRLFAVLTASGTGSRTAAERFGFELATNDEEVIFGSPEVNCVFVCSLHDTHAGYVVKALSRGKHVFVEKPLALSREELERVSAAYHSAIEAGKPRQLMVGYNRRFSPLTDEVVSKVGRGTMLVSYRVNAGEVPAESWIQDPEVGGGRIIGEACHFIDFMIHVTGSLPSQVHAVVMNAARGTQDSVCINVKFENGSVGSIVFVAVGSKDLAKERIEVHRAGISAVIKDFRELEIYGLRKRYRRRLLNQDKGQRGMIERFVTALRKGGEPLIPFNELWAGSLATLNVLESLRTGKAVAVE